MLVAQRKMVAIDIFKDELRAIYEVISIGLTILSIKK